MAITVPDITKLRPTIEPVLSIPCKSAAGLTNPGPVAAATTQNSSEGSTLVALALSTTRGRYLGMNIMSNVPPGGAPTALSGVIIEGFAGMTPGSPIYIASDGTLTHTGPTNNVNVAGGGGGTVPVTDKPIGIALTATRAFFYVAGPQ
jgi:hypothetical protein